MVHLALVEEVVHVAVAQVPLQEPAEHLLQPYFALVPPAQHILQISQTDYHFLKDGLHHQLQLL